MGRACTGRCRLRPEPGANEAIGERQHRGAVGELVRDVMEPLGAIRHYGEVVVPLARPQPRADGARSIASEALHLRGFWHFRSVALARRIEGAFRH
jgi:hypothetical protein